MPSLRSRKGYVLPMVIMFTIIMAVASVGLFAGVRYLTMETSIQETEYIKGYYYCVAGLRYASILLRAPDNLTWTDNPRGTTISVSSTTPLGGDLGIQAPHNMTITITERTTQEQTDGKGLYNVSAAYN